MQRRFYPISNSARLARNEKTPTRVSFFVSPGGVLPFPQLNEEGVGLGYSHLFPLHFLYGIMEAVNNSKRRINIFQSYKRVLKFL